MNFTLNLGNLHEAHAAAEELALPIIKVGQNLSKFRYVVDYAAVSRRGAAVIGPKGIGKTVGLNLALRWFSDIERAKRDRDNAYQVRRVLAVSKLRDATYRHTGVLIARSISPAYVDRVKGRKKDENEVRQDVVQLLLNNRYAVIAADEAEIFSDDTLHFIRDLMADAEEADPVRFRVEEATRAAGVGVVIVGDESLRARLGTTREGSERWARLVDLEALTPGQAARIYREWLPGFTSHVASVGDHAWETYVSSLIFRGQPVSFRLIENHVRMYAHGMMRSDQSITALDAVPFNKDVFEEAAASAGWAQASGGANQSLPLPIKSNRSTRRAS